MVQGRDSCGVEPLVYTMNILRMLIMGMLYTVNCEPVDGGLKDGLPLVQKLYGERFC